jgi:hypothetical protein
MKAKKEWAHHRLHEVERSRDIW